MTPAPRFQRLAFFTRLLDAAPAAERYRLAAEQIAHAERFGFDAAWVAQHHFHEHEGGLPSPFVFLGHLAARTPAHSSGYRDNHAAAGIAGARGRGRHRAGPDQRRPAGTWRRQRRQSDRLRRVSSSTANTATSFSCRNLARLRGALKGDPIPGGDTLYPAQPRSRRTDLAGDVLGLRRRAGRVWPATG